MIFKSFELGKIDLNQIKIILLYGHNDSLKKLAISKLSEGKKKTYFYDEKEILENEINFFENTLNKSLFDTEKIIVIKRATNNIAKIIDQIDTSKLEDWINYKPKTSLEEGIKKFIIWYKEFYKLN